MDNLYKDKSLEQSTEAKRSDRCVGGAVNTIHDGDGDLFAQEANHIMAQFLVLPLESRNDYVGLSVDKDCSAFTLNVCM